MNHRRVYVFLILVLLGLTGLKNIDIFQAEEVRKGSRPMGQPELWTDLVARYLNEEEIHVVINGTELKQKKDQKIYVGNGKAIMIPLDLIPEAFSCAANVYDGKTLMLERGDQVSRILMGEDQLWVNEVPVTVPFGFEEKDGNYYVSASVIEKSLGYRGQWTAEQDTLYFTGPNGDRYLPYAYDYRERGRVPAPKNQGTFGTCWAFASLLAMETRLLPEQAYDFSPDHMSLNNSFHLTQDEGGEYTMSMAYLLAWQGPVLEKDDPYGDAFSPRGLTAVRHVQEIQILPSKDYEKIKRAILLYGGVQSSLYTSLQNDESRSAYYSRETSSYCYIGTEKPNHDIVIIGWDDNYPKENFSIDVEGNGAFICANSWGEEFGDDGYFYVSYYDTNIGIHNILYTSIEDTDNYDAIYQSDLCGWVGQLGYGKETAYFANVYEAEEKELLSAVGFYATGEDTEYEVYVATGVSGPEDFDKKELLAQGKVKNSGYYTVSLEREVPVEKGSSFAVIVWIKTPGSVHPVAIEYNSEDKNQLVDLEDGQGYISFKGNNWERSETTQKCNVCLKAYTKKQ